MQENTNNQDNKGTSPKGSEKKRRVIYQSINWIHVVVGLIIGIGLAFSTQWITGLTSSTSTSRNPWTKLRFWYSYSRFDSDSDDHASWLSWHNVQLKNPFISHQDQSQHTDQEPTDSTHQPPSLREEIKKIINSNKLKLDNFNIIHSSDEL